MKRLLTLALLLLLSLPALAQRPKVGVVLCGGGAKGAAHVGVLKVLEENDIPIDYIVGTSMGAIVGGLYAIGYSAAELDSLIMAQDWNYVMSDRIPRRETYFDQRKYQDNYLLRIPFGAGDYSRLAARDQRPGARDQRPGLPPRREGASLLDNIPLAVVTGQNVYNLFSRLSVGYQDSLDFSRMPIPFACVAVDVIGKKEVVFKSGNFVDAIRASMAIPGYFAPVRIDDMVLVDGGMLNNYPVDVARAMGADIIIGVRLSEPTEEKPQVNSIGDLFSEMLDVYTNAKLAAAIADTDLLITAETKGYNMLSFDNKSLRTLIDNGEKAARARQEDLDGIKSRLDRSEQQFVGPLKAPERYRKAVRLDRDTVTLRSVSYEGLRPKDAQWLLRNSPVKSGARLSGRAIDAEIARFYNTGAFESVTYQLRGHEDPYDMQLNFKGGRHSGLGVGVRFDSEEIAATLLGIGFNENALYGSKFTATVKLAYNMQAQLQYTYAFQSLAQFNLSYKYRSSNLNLNHELVQGSMNFRDHALTAMFSTTKMRSLAIDLGGRLDFMNYRDMIGNVSGEAAAYDLDFKRNTFVSAFARFQLDQRDQEYFPTRGPHFDASFAYYPGKWFGESHPPFGAANLHFSTVIPAGNRLAFLLSLDSRILLGNDVPLAFANMMGGSLAGRYMDQQIPFIGFGQSHIFDRALGSATLDVRFRFLENHYIFASGAYARDFRGLATLFDNEPVIGTRLGYAYNSIIGPLAFNLFWSNYTKKVGAYVSIGYNF